MVGPQQRRELRGRLCECFGLIVVEPVHIYAVASRQLREHLFADPEGALILPSRSRSEQHRQARTPQPSPQEIDHGLALRAVAEPVEAVNAEITAAVTGEIAQKLLSRRLNTKNGAHRRPATRRRSVRGKNQNTRNCFARFDRGSQQAGFARAAGP